MSKLESRRDLMKKLTSAGVAALVGSGVAPAQSAAGSPSGTSAPAADILVRLTSGAMRLAPEASLQWRPERGSSTDAVVLDPAKSYQEILGVDRKSTRLNSSPFSI